MDKSEVSRGHAIDLPSIASYIDAKILIEVEVGTKRTMHVFNFCKFSKKFQIF